jgi:hypothetical protein
MIYYVLAPVSFRKYLDPRAGCSLQASSVEQDTLTSCFCRTVSDVPPSLSSGKHRLSYSIMQTHVYSLTCILHFFLRNGPHLKNSRMCKNGHVLGRTINSLSPFTFCTKAYSQVQVGLSVTDRRAHLIVLCCDLKTQWGLCRCANDPAKTYR